MNRKIKAHPTEYMGTLFRSRLEARWAAFFDLIGWEWDYEPVDLEGWTPDFWVRFPCHHSECDGSHELYVEVKPYRYLSEFSGHPAYYPDGAWTQPSPAVFGVHPSVTRWAMVHGAGGGIENLYGWLHGRRNPGALWREAGNRVQWKGDGPTRVYVSMRPAP